MKVGIDLGTTYSLISFMNTDGKPAIIPDSYDIDNVVTPSIVHIGNNIAAVGHHVRMMMNHNPELDVIRFFKRNFGDSSPIYDDINGNEWYPESIAALVLKKMINDANRFTGLQVDGAVITIPAHFNDSQRKSVIDAAHLADIPLLGLVEEPVAAALHYGINQNIHDRLLLVYDLGGGTFDVTILSLNEKVVSVIAKDGDSELGGKDFDDQIIQILVEKYIKIVGKAPPQTKYTFMELRRVSEDIKMQLSTPLTNYCKTDLLIGDRHIEVIISKREFEKCIYNYIEKTIEIIARCLSDVGLVLKDIEALLLVGGSSMIPYIRNRLIHFLSIDEKKVFFHEPMMAVALGASMFACQRSGESEKFNIPPDFNSITGYNIGILIYNSSQNRDDVDVLIKKNTPLPAKCKRKYFTTRENQSRIIIEVVQFRDQSELLNVGQMNIGPLPELSINSPIEVTLEVTNDGVIKVIALDPSNGEEIKQQFSNNSDHPAWMYTQHNLINSTKIININIAK